MKQHLTHPIAPVWDERSRVLILGSFPSVKSREENFFYGHPQNRFWRVLSAVLDCPLPDSVEEKRRMLLAHGIALWDVIASCEIEGSADASIENAVPNDLAPIFAAAEIRAVYCNGTAAWTLYEKHIRPLLGRAAVKLPSTSPANARWTVEKLVEAWRVIR